MGDTTSGFSQAERAAMKQRAAELREMQGAKGAAKRAKELTRAWLRSTRSPARSSRSRHGCMSS